MQEGLKALFAVEMRGLCGNCGYGGVMPGLRGIDPHGSRLRPQFLLLRERALDRLDPEFARARAESGMPLGVLSLPPGLIARKAKGRLPLREIAPSVRFFEDLVFGSRSQLIVTSEDA
jgi:hypothetical protein